MSAPQLGRAANGPARDEGFSLVELALYVAVLGIIATVVAATMLTLFRTETTVSALTTSANDAQNAATLVRADVRNARDLRVSADGATLLASVATRAADVSWVCVAWQVSAGPDGASLTRAERPDESGVAWGPPVTLLSHLTSITTAGPATPYFTADLTSGAVVRVAWRVATTDRGSIDITGEARSRAFGDAPTPASTCFA